jgi:hypothetical protein
MFALLALLRVFLIMVATTILIIGFSGHHFEGAHHLLFFMFENVAIPGELSSERRKPCVVEAYFQPLIPSTSNNRTGECTVEPPQCGVGKVRVETLCEFRYGHFVVLCPLLFPIRFSDSGVGSG